jgi:hypothetical protein
MQGNNTDYNDRCYGHLKFTGELPKDFRLQPSD